jgi:soluble lytic murein transglycosylase-like protein
MRVLGIFLILAGSAWAGEYAVFGSGSRMLVDSHEIHGDTVRLHIGGGTIEMDASHIVGFEPSERAARLPAVPTAAAIAAGAAPASSGATSKEEARRLVAEAARKYEIPEALLHSVVKAESAYRQDAVSPKGAIGLMQLMPGTARMLGADPTDAAQNVDAGTRYLAELLLKYDGGVYRALAAYNAGPGAVARYGGNIPPYRETREYVRRIVESWRKASNE